MSQIREEELEGWGAKDTPNDGYASEGELNCQKLVSAQNRKKKKSGGFQCMGLSTPILRGVIRKGYQVPTPIQRRTIPIILEGKDVVAMARTGSGKSAAFLIPMLEKLKTHSAKVGVRALILSPTRELATQTLSFVKAIGRFTDLRAAVILGGESMDSQFAALHENPDIIIATPKRFKHICLEMNLKLDTVEYVVFDEIDRLFEMQFSDQLNYILSCLNPERQTLLFSATLPKVILEFSQMGLSNPVLIRLDVDTKISEKLELCFFQVNNEDKIALLLHLLRNIIPPYQQTVLFVPTRHHVEFLHQLFLHIGINSTFIFSSLDSAARKINMVKFRKKIATLLVVTDVAARGLDVPMLDNVINFNFPSKAKLFVHRVGRAARCHRSGTAYSFVAPDESAFLLELHLFLNQSVVVAPYPAPKKRVVDRMFGRVPQDIIDDSADYLEKTLHYNGNLTILLDCANNSLKKYLKSRPLAAPETVRRLKEELWDRNIGYHPLLFTSTKEQEVEIKRLTLLDSLRGIRPKLTVFDIKKDGKKCKDGKNKFMIEKRRVDQGKIDMFHKKVEDRSLLKIQKLEQEEEAEDQRNRQINSEETDIQDAFNEIVGRGSKKPPKPDRKKIKPTSVVVKDKTQFIPYFSEDRHTEEGYSVISNFEREAKNLAFDLQGDEDQQLVSRKAVSVWDRKQKKYINLDSKPKKILTESGVYVDASYKKDLYAKWKLKMNLGGQTQQSDEVDYDELAITKKDMKRGKGFVDLSENSKGKRLCKLPQPKEDSERKVSSKANAHNLISFEQRKKKYNEKAKEAHRLKQKQLAKKKHSANAKSNYQRNKKNKR